MIILHVSKGINIWNQILTTDNYNVHKIFRKRVFLSIRVKINAIRKEFVSTKK